MLNRIAGALVMAVTLTSAALAQGPIQRAGRALDNAGRSVREGVEGAVARGQVTAQERQLLTHVSERLNRDKRLRGSALQVIVDPAGGVTLRGSVTDAAAKSLAAELAANTVGVTRVVDELAVAKSVRVIEPAPAAVIEPAPATTVIVAPDPATRPVQSKVIVKP